MALPFFPVLAYYPYWTTTRYDYPLDALPMHVLSIVGHYAIWPDPTSPGALFTPNDKSPADPEVTWPEPDLITRVHNAGGLVFLVIGGAETEPVVADTNGGADEGFRQLCGHPGSGARRQAFVDSLETFVAAQGYDGIDIDWEYPGFIRQFTLINATATTPITFTVDGSADRTVPMEPDFVNGRLVDIQNVVGVEGANGENLEVANWTATATPYRYTFTIVGSSGSGAWEDAPDNVPYVTPGPEERNGLADLIDRLRTMLDGLGGEQKYLTVVPPASDDNGKYFPVGDRTTQEDTTLANLDWVAAQSYGLHGPWSQHAGHVGAIHSASGDDEWHFPFEPPNNDKNLSFDSTVRYWHETRGVPKEKLWLGVGTYGYNAWFAEDLYDANPDGVTIVSAANTDPAVFHTAADHYLEAGDLVTLSGLAGGTWGPLNGQTFTVQSGVGTVGDPQFTLVGVNGSTRGTYTPSSGTAVPAANTWGDWRDFVTLGGHTEHWDADALATYLRKDTGPGVISLPSARSIRESVNYVADNLLSGLIIWSVAKDWLPDYEAQPLMTAVHRARYAIEHGMPRIRAWLDLNNSGFPDDDPAKEISAYVDIGGWTDAPGGIEFAEGRPNPTDGTVAGYCTVQMLSEPGNSISPEISTGPFRTTGDSWDAGSFTFAVPFTGGTGNQQRLAQWFVPDHTDIYDVVQAELVRVGTPAGTVRAEIWTANASGVPQSLLSLEAVSLEYDITDEVGTTPGDVRFRFPSPVALASGGNYAMVLITTGYTRTAGVTELKWRTGNTWDNFDGADTTGELAAPGGEVWNESSGEWGRTGNVLYSATDDNDDRILIQTGSSTGKVLVQMKSDSYTAATVGLVFRAPVSPFFPALLFVELGFGQVWLRKSVMGEFTELASAAQTLVDGTQYTVQVDYRGGHFEVRVGGVLKITHDMADTDLALDFEGQTYAGFRIGGGGQNARFQTFIATYRSGFMEWDGATWTQYEVSANVPTDGHFAVTANAIQKGRMFYLVAEWEGESYPQWTGYLDEVTLDVDGRVGQLSFIDLLERASRMPGHHLALRTNMPIDELIDYTAQTLLGLDPDDQIAIGGGLTQVIPYFYAEPNTTPTELLELLTEAGAARHWIQAANSANHPTAPKLYQVYKVRTAEEESAGAAPITEDWTLAVGKRVLYRDSFDENFNALRVTVNTRKPGEADSVVYQHGVDEDDGEPFGASETKTFEIHFTNPVSALHALESGEDYTAGFTINITGGWAHVRDVAITGPASATDLEKFQVRGTPLEPRHQYDVTRQDDLLVEIQGTQELEVNNPYVQTRVHADWLRDELLRQMKRRWPEPTVERENDFPSVLERRVGHKVQLWLHDVGPEGVYYIEYRQVTIEGAMWHAEYRLRRPTEGNTLG